MATRRSPNLRLSSSTLGNLANPRFAQAAGTAIGNSMLGVEVRQDKEEEKLFLEELIEAGKTGDLSTQGGLLASRGTKIGNSSMVLQGTQMMASVNKQNALIQIETLMDVYANPAKTKEERASALQQAEGQALSGIVSMTPQSFNALVAGANGRYESTLSTEAKKMAATRGAGAISEYSNLYGAENSWRIAEEVKSQTAVQDTLSQQSTNAFVSSQAGSIAKLDSQIAQYQTVPVEQWNMDSLRQLFNERLQIEQEIVGKGGNGNPSQFIGGAARFYDEVYATQLQRKEAVAKEADVRVENQRELLYGIAKQQRYATSDQFIKEVRKSPLYEGWDESDWDSLEADIASFQELRSNKSEYIMNGKLAPTDEKWLAKYSDYFSDDDDFQKDLKAYRAENTDNLTRLSAGNVLTSKVREARSQQRQDSRSDKQIKAKATDFVEAFVGAGDPDDLRFNPNMPVEGGFGQGNSVYDVIRRLKLTGNDSYDKLISKVGTRIKNNPNANMRETVMDAFQELYIKTPGERGVQARQAEIAEQTNVTRAGIKKLQKDYKQSTGEELSDADAAAIIQQQLANALLADSERMSSRVKAIREGTPVRGEDPSTVPSARDYAEIGLQGAGFIYDKTVVPAGKLLRGEGLPAYDKTKRQ